MVEGIRLKICGLTALVDVEAADRAGADYLGFILFPGSSRYIPLPQFQAMAPRLPDRAKVAVTVAPDMPELELMKDDFDFFQIHFRHDTTLRQIAGWAKVVGPERLWLAPKLPPEIDVDPTWLSLAGHVLLDTYQPDAFGGSGRTGDWLKFSRLQEKHPQRKWILAGGLNPSNVAEAVQASGAKIIDVNSGVESAPGIKDHVKLRALRAALQQRPR